VPSFSIYRGQAGSGKGEGPGVVVPFGEQYLDAAAELWDRDLSDSMRSWLTLDGRAEDYSLLGDTMEAWSYFPCDGAGTSWRVVARLARDGVYDRRPAYFAHGRAWKAADCTFDNDPGTLIGSSAFSPPWREQRLDFAEAPIKPDVMQWRALLENADERVAAVNYLAALYYGRTESIPIAVTVEPKEFLAGGAIHKLIAFARAALPWEVKLNSRIRIYTSLPSTFLRQLKADLIAIPQDLARAAFDANPAVLLLDRLGKNYSGTPISATAAGAFCEGYAERVVDRFLDTPPAVFVSALLPFSARVTPVIGTKTSGAALLSAVSNLYDLVAVGTDQNQIDQLFPFLFKNANRNNEGVQPWNLLISPQQWAAASELVIESMCGLSAVTADAAQLRGLVWQEANRRGLKIESPEDATAAQTVWLFERNLVGLAPALDRLRHAPAAAVYALLEPGSPTVATVARLLEHSELPESWLAGLPRVDKPEAVVIRVCAAAVAEEALTGQPTVTWAPLLQSVLTGLLSSRDSSSLNPIIADTLSSLRVPGDIRLDTLVTEAIYRISPEAARPRISRLEAIKDPNGRRWIFQNQSHADYSFFSKEFQIPRAWDTDVKELLGADESALRNLDLARLVSFAAGVERLTAPLAKALDHRMAQCAQRLLLLFAQRGQASAPERDAALAATKTLIDRGQWLKWRRYSQLDYSMLRLCAMAWLVAKDNADVRLEDWEQAMLDLGDKMSGAEIEQMRRIAGSFAWPPVTLFEAQQIQQLVRKASDWGALAEIAEMWRYEDRRVETLGGIPSGALSWLRVSPPPSTSLTVDLAQAVLRNAGHRRRIAEDNAKRFLKTWMSRPEGEALAVAIALDWLGEPDIESEIFRLLLAKSFLNEQLEILESHAAKMSGTHAKGFDSIELSKAVAHYRDQGYPHLRAAIERAASGGPLYQEAVIALVSGGGVARCWERVAEEAKADRDPVSQLLRPLSALDAAGQASLDQNGWTTFAAACGHHEELIYAYGRTVPALVLAAYLRPNDDMGAVTNGLLPHVSRSQMLDGKWWDAVFETMQACPRRDGRPRAGERFEYAATRVLTLANDLFRSDFQWERRRRAVLAKALERTESSGQLRSQPDHPAASLMEVSR